MSLFFAGLRIFWVFCLIICDGVWFLVMVWFGLWFWFWFGLVWLVFKNKAFLLQKYPATFLGGGGIQKEYSLYCSYLFMLSI